MGNINLQDFSENAKKVWMSIKNYAVKGGRATTKTLLELYYVMIDKNTASTDKLLIGAAIAYQVLPTDLLSKKRFGLFGLTDNAATLALAYKKMKSAITPEIEAKVEATLVKWFGEKDGEFVEFEEIEQ